MAISVILLQSEVSRELFVVTTVPSFFRAAAVSSYPLICTALFSLLVSMVPWLVILPSLSRYREYLLPSARRLAEPTDRVEEEPRPLSAISKMASTATAATQPANTNTVLRFFRGCFFFTVFLGREACLTSFSSSSSQSSSSSSSSEVSLVSLSLARSSGFITLVAPRSSFWF